MNLLNNISSRIQALKVPSINRDSSQELSNNPLKHAKLIMAFFVIFCIIGSYWYSSETGALDIIMDRDMLQTEIDRMGIWGPLTVISLIAGAIVFSPLPSAPISLAAGAVYGHIYGTIYVLTGSLLGALAAFGIARLLGRDILVNWLGKKFSLNLPDKQNTLMGLVFVSRLIPFISFDSVSYIAGLTSLTFWRFALATFGGIIPASFVLAYFGSEIAAADAGQSMFIVFLLGAMTLAPIVIITIKKRLRSNTV